MADLVVNTAFSTGPDDKLATVDVYAEKKPNTPKNNGITSVGKELLNATAMEINRIAISGEIIEVMNFDKPIPTIDLAAAQKKLEVALGDKVVIQGKLLDALKNSVGLPVLAIIGPDGKVMPGASVNVAGKNITVNDVRATVGNVSEIRKKIGDVKTAQDAMALVGTITGNTQLGKIAGVSEVIKVMGTVANTLNVLRIPELYDVLYNEQHEDDKKPFLLANVRSAILASDLHAVNKTLTECGAAAILARVPDAITLLVAFYQLPPTVTSPNVAEANNLVNLLNGLDSRWAKYKRNGVDVVNLEHFTYANDVCLKVLSKHANYVVPCMIAKSYRMVDLKSTAKQLFPYAAIGTTQ